MGLLQVLLPPGPLQRFSRLLQLEDQVLAAFHATLWLPADKVHYQRNAQPDDLGNDLISVNVRNTLSV